MSSLNSENKTKVISRSPRFPAYTLETAIETIADARKFGKTVTDAQIAGEGSANSGSFMRKKAALGYFGLITGRGENVQITDLAEGIIYPKPGEREKLLRQAFLTPEIFKKLYTTTTKNVPIAISVFGNVLIRDYGIQPAAKNEFLSVFIRSGIYAGLIKYGDDTKSDITLLDSETSEKANENNSEKTEETTEGLRFPIAATSYQFSEIFSPEVQSVELILTNGKAKIIVPKDLTSADIKRLKAQIEILGNIFEENATG